MTPTPVGMRCPECASQKTKTRSLASLSAEPRVTYALIAINVIVYLAELSSGSSFNGPAGTVYVHGALFGPAVADGEWWRIITSGFLHATPIHIAFNMYFLYFLGRLLEPSIGSLRFGAIYAVSLVGGSLGALIASPDVPSLGASGAVFGMMGAAILVMRARGISPMQSGLGPTLILNLGITLVIPGISIGAHIGGLLAGGVAGLVLFEVAERKPSLRKPALGLCVVLVAVLFAAGLAVAKSGTVG